MATKGSREWFKRVVKDWTRYVGDRATLREYAAGGAPYLGRLRQDLKEWWGDHPDPAKRLTPEEIEALAQRLADYLHSWTSPITPPGMIQQFYAEWSTFMDDPLPADSASQISQMVQPPTAVPGREDDGDGEGEK